MEVLAFGQKSLQEKSYGRVAHVRCRGRGRGRDKAQRARGGNAAGAVGVRVLSRCQEVNEDSLTQMRLTAGLQAYVAEEAEGVTRLNVPAVDTQEAPLG